MGIHVPRGNSVNITIARYLVEWLVMTFSLEKEEVEYLALPRILYLCTYTKVIIQQDEVF